MEYKSEDENGDSAWYKLVGDRNIPVKVSDRTIAILSLVRGLWRVSSLHKRTKTIS